MADDADLPPPPPPGPSRNLLSGLIILNFIVFFAAAVILILGQKRAREMDRIKQDTSILHKKDHAESEGGHGKSDKNMMDALVSKSATYFSAGDFTANLLGLEGVVKVNINLEMDAEVKEKEIKARTAQVRDIIIDQLNKRTVEQLQTVSGRDELRDEITEAVNKILSEGQIKRTVFSTFILRKF